MHLSMFRRLRLNTSITDQQTDRLTDAQMWIVGRGQECKNYPLTNYFTSDELPPLMYRVINYPLTNDDKSNELTETNNIFCHL